MPSEQLRILCVDDHALLVEGLRARFALEPDLECVGHCPSAANLLQEVKGTRPDIVLIDLEMPGPDPFEALGDLHRRCPEVRTIILSAHVREHYFEAAAKAGAWGYLSKGDDPDHVVEGIRKVGRGEFALSPEVAERCGLLRAGRARGGKPCTRLSQLTRSEMEILRMIARGLSRCQIAKGRHCSPKTVDVHKASIKKKLGIHEDVELARFAIREGLVEP